MLLENSTQLGFGCFPLYFIFKNLLSGNRWKASGSMGGVDEGFLTGLKLCDGVSLSSTVKLTLEKNSENSYLPPLPH